MEIILCSTLISAFFIISLIFGFYVGRKYEQKQAKKEGIELTQDNQEAIKQLLNWISFRG
jgi:uncharacterized protein YneF (UPF0154 family)